jgi:hypothetical protein
MSWLRSSQSPVSIIKLLTTKVAQAQPTTPKPGQWPMPKVNSSDKGIFTNRAPACSQVTKRGKPRLWFRVPYILNSKEGIKAIAKIRK